MQEMADEWAARTRTKTRVTLQGVAETVLIPLVGRALDATTQSPILGDPYAKGVMEKLDYDFGRFPMPPVAAAAIALRTRIYDRWAKAFLTAHAHAHVTVLHLACGLDSRCQRIDWGTQQVRWIDVDLPEVVSLRRRVLPASFPRKDYRLLDADITTATWLEHMPTDRPVLVIMEGLVSYLRPEDGRNLLGRLVQRLKEGELHFDCMSAMGLQGSERHDESAVGQTGSVFKWAIDDLRDIEDIHPRLRLLETIRYLEAPGLEEFPWLNRVAFYFMSWVPSLRDSVRFVRFGFSENGN